MAQLVLAHPSPKAEMSVNQIKVLGSQPEPYLGLDFRHITSKGKLRHIKEAPKIRVAMNGVTFPATKEKQGPGENATSATSLDRNGSKPDTRQNYLGFFIINLKN